MSAANDSKYVAQALWTELGLPPEALSHLVLSDSPDPVVDSSFKLGTAAQVAIGLAGLSAAHLHALRTGEEQDVTVDARHAVLEFKSEALYHIDDQLVNGFVWDDIAGVYETKNNGFVRIHTNFPHHRQGILDILQCEPTREAVAHALRQWGAVEFEDLAASRNMCATALRSFEEWDNHPQGIALANSPPVALIKIGEAPKRMRSSLSQRPLEGMRVLDLTRVLAGPICGRTLAAHGADVLLITSPSLPDLPFLDAETSRGKRTTQLDLTTPRDREVLATLANEADVFLQAYRPGGLCDKGFGPEDLASVRSGIVYASLTAYGWQGPWKDRRGFDSLVQTATGFNVAESKAYAAYNKGSNAVVEPIWPKPLPMQALDHTAAYLLAFGINAALCKTFTEGGSYEVRVSLAAVGQWIRSLGQLSPQIAFRDGPPLPQRVIPLHPEIAALAMAVPRRDHGMKAPVPNQQCLGQKMTVIKHAALLEKTPVWDEEGLGAPVTLDEDSAEWLPLLR